MDAHNSKANQNRQRENENPPSSPQHKNQRSLANTDQPPSSSPVPSDEPKKITGLIDDCLQNIFGYLDVNDLFNVAVANEWLRPAAGVVYKRKFGLNRVCIVNDQSSSTRGLKRCTTVSGDQIICVIGLKTSLQFLRCLGSSISGLEIFYDEWNERQSQYIHQYVNKYCAETLEKVEFWSKPNEILIKHFNKPFPNVQAVKVTGSGLRSVFRSFSKWFPNLRSLNLNDVRGLRCIVVAPFQHLRDLRIEINIGYCERGFSIIDATRLLQMCPELHSLDINVLYNNNITNGITFDTLLMIIKSNRNICNLKLTQHPPMTVLGVQQLVIDHPLLVKLELAGYAFGNYEILSLTRQLNSLKYFRFSFSTFHVDKKRLVADLNSEWRLSSQPFVLILQR